MELSSVELPKLIKAYKKAKAEKKILTLSQKAEMSKIDSCMSDFEGEIKSRLVDSGQEGTITTEGSAKFNTKAFCSYYVGADVGDRANLLELLKHDLTTAEGNQDAFIDLVRINALPIKQYIERRRASMTPEEAFNDVGKIPGIKEYEETKLDIK